MVQKAFGKGVTWIDLDCLNKKGAYAKLSKVSRSKKVKVYLLKMPKSFTFSTSVWLQLWCRAKHSCLTAVLLFLRHLNSMNIYRMFNSEPSASGFPRPYLHNILKSSQFVCVRWRIRVEMRCSALRPHAGKKREQKWTKNKMGQLEEGRSKKTGTKR